MPESSLDVLRRMPKQRAMAYATGIMSLLSWNPSLRAHYSLADLALLETLAKSDDLPGFYSKWEDQPRDSSGRWTVEGRPDLKKTSKALEKYRNVPLTPQDVMSAVHLWEWMRADSGEWTPHAIEELAAHHLASPKSSKYLAALAWMVERASREAA